MTLQQIEYIIALDNHRNFVKAAESCYVTQPTLTMQVQKLENEIGVKLFDRSKKPLIPTSIGNIFIEKSRLILRNIEELKSIVEDETESLKGNFKMAIIPTIAPYLLPRLLPFLIEELPDTHLEIVELQTEQIIERMKKSTLDFAILSTPIQDSAIREVPVYHEPFMLYLNPSHKLIESKKADINHLDLDKLLILQEGHCFRNQALSLCANLKKTAQHTFDYKSGSIESLMALADKDMGYTLVPELAVIDKKDTNQIKEFETPIPVREISIIAHRSFAKEALLEKLKSIIINNLPSHFTTSKKHKRLKWQ